MRQIVLMALVIAGSVTGLAVPAFGLLFYIWFGLLRPDVLAYMGPNYYSSILAVCTLLGSVRMVHKLFNLFLNPSSIAFLVFQLPIALSVAFAVDPQLAVAKYLPFLQMSLILLLIPVLIDNLRALKGLVIAIAMSMGFLGFKFGSWGLVAGGVRFQQGSSGFHADNNSLALGLVASLPLCWAAARLCNNRKWMKVTFYGFAFFTIATIFMTHSRGGILSLIVPLLMVVQRSKRRALTLLVLALVCLPAPLLLWDSLSSRMATLEAPLEEVSAASRYDLNLAALKMIRDYPLVGVGFGTDNFAQLSEGYLVGKMTPHVAHNNYLQMWVDSGVFAFLIYCVMLFGSIRWLGRTYNRFKDSNSDVADISAGMQASLGAFAVGSTFVSRTNYDFIYILLLSVGSLYLVVRNVDLDSSVDPVGLSEPRTLGTEEMSKVEFADPA